MIVDDRLWFVIQISDLPSFLQILQIVVSSEDSGKTFVDVFFLFDSQSVLLGGFSHGDRQLYLLHAFTLISGSGFETDNLVRVSWFLFMQF